MTGQSDAADGTKLGAYIQVSQEVIDHLLAFRATEQRWRDATPEERAERQREAARRRAAERSTAEPVPLTVDRLVERMGWSLAYAEHLVQPYCSCGEAGWGWDYCMHARDLGLDDD